MTSAEKLRQLIMLIPNERDRAEALKLLDEAVAPPPIRTPADTEPITDGPVRSFTDYESEMRRILRPL